MIRKLLLIAAMCAFAGAVAADDSVFHCRWHAGADGAAGFALSHAEFRAAGGSGSAVPESLLFDADLFAIAGQSDDGAAAAQSRRS